MPHKMVNEKLAEQAKQKIQEARENRKTQDGKKSVYVSLSLFLSFFFALSLYFRNVLQEHLIHINMIKAQI